MKIRVPADIDMADRILAGLTLRQLGIIGGDVVTLWACWLWFGRHLPLFVFAFLAAPIAAVGWLWAIAPIQGTHAERILIAGLDHLRRGSRRVRAPEGLSPLPGWWPLPQERVTAFEFPARSIEGDGLVRLGDHQAVVVCRASSMNFGLRSDREQQALTEGFGRVLNSLESPVQFLMRSERADLREVIQAVRGAADTLAHPKLRAAAAEHAEFLADLAARRDVLVHRHLLCLPGGAGDAQAAALERRASEVAGLLRGCGITARRLDSTEVALALGRATDPACISPVRHDAEQIVRGA